MTKDISKRRVLFKVSGEALMGEAGMGIDPQVVSRIACDIEAAVRLGTRVAIVVGGGNFIRGASVAKKGNQRVVGDHMGMLGTLMNGLALKQAFDDRSVDSVVISGLAVPAVCETFMQSSAFAHFESGRVIIFVGGMGNPFFTTDTVAVLRAAEMECDSVFKGTQVDGVYSDDPKKNPQAKRFDSLTHSQALSYDLRIMDTAAIALARDNQIPIIVFSIHEAGAFLDILKGHGRATYVCDDQ